jgi:toxin HigB-1
MEVRFADESLQRIEADPDSDGGLSQAVARAFRKRIAFIRSALDERDFYAMKSLHFEQLQGKRDHQHSMRLNDQWRLIVELEGKAPNKVVAVVSIEDYH